MNISLPDPMRDFVQQRIDSGLYASVSDYVRDLIRRDQGIAENEARWLAELDASIAQGLAELDAGGGEDLHTACAEIRAEIGALSPKTAAR